METEELAMRLWNQRVLSSVFVHQALPPRPSIQVSPELTEVGRGRSVNLASVGPALRAAC